MAEWLQSERKLSTPPVRGLVVVFPMQVNLEQQQLKKGFLHVVN